jgi:hypothetical protein
MSTGLQDGDETMSEHESVEDAAYDEFAVASKQKARNWRESRTRRGRESANLIPPPKKPYKKKISPEEQKQIETFSKIHLDKMKDCKLTISLMFCQP